MDFCHKKSYLRVHGPVEEEQIVSPCLAPVLRLKPRSYRARNLALWEFVSKDAIQVNVITANLASVAVGDEKLRRIRRPLNFDVGRYFGKAQLPIPRRSPPREIYILSRAELLFSYRVKAHLVVWRSRPACNGRAARE